MSVEIGMVVFVQNVADLLNILSVLLLKWVIDGFAMNVDILLGLHIEDLFINQQNQRTMTRERYNELKRVSKERYLSEHEQALFTDGAEWADQHPRKGLWDAEKVISFLKEHATVENSSNINIHINGVIYHFVNDFIEDLRKAMED